jgi:hypothetical protein
MDHILGEGFEMRALGRTPMFLVNACAVVTFETYEGHSIPRSYDVLVIDIHTVPLAEYGTQFGAR